MQLSLAPLRNSMSHYVRRGEQFQLSLTCKCTSPGYKTIPWHCCYQHPLCKECLLSFSTTIFACQTQYSPFVLISHTRYTAAFISQAQDCWLNGMCRLTRIPSRPWLRVKGQVLRLWKRILSQLWQLDEVDYRP